MFLILLVAQIEELFFLHGQIFVFLPNFLTFREKLIHNLLFDSLFLTTQRLWIIT